MKDLTVPLKSTATVGLALLGMTIFSPLAFSQTTLSPTDQGALQQPYAAGPNLVPSGHGPGYFDIITDVPPGINRYYPPGPLLETQAIENIYRGPIVPSGPLIQWEDNGLVQNPNSTFTSAVKGSDSTWISTTPGSNAIAADYGMGTPASSVVGPTNVYSSPPHNMTPTGTVVTFQSPVHNLTPTGTVVTTSSPTVVTNTATTVTTEEPRDRHINWWWGDSAGPQNVNYCTGSLVTCSQAVYGGDPYALAPVVPCWHHCKAEHHHNNCCNVAPVTQAVSGCDVAPVTHSNCGCHVAPVTHSACGCNSAAVYNVPVTTTTGCTGTSVMTTPTSSNTVIMNQGVHGYDGTTNIVPEGTTMYITPSHQPVNINPNVNPNMSMPSN